MDKQQHKVLVPESMITMLFEDISTLHEMLGKLISMYQQESDLKKHHKAYLHIRDQADELCEVYSACMSAMQKRWFNEMVQTMGNNVLTGKLPVSPEEKKS